MADYICSYSGCKKPITHGLVIFENKESQRYFHGKPMDCDEKHVLETGEKIEGHQLEFSTFESLVKYLAGKKAKQDQADRAIH